MRLLFFASLLLLSANLARAEPHRIFIAGDSTAAEYGPERAPQAGWGQLLQDWFDPAQWQVHNHAKGGRSTRSFIAEGRLEAIANQLQRGDILLIQFGHNDAKHEDPTRYTDAHSDYQQFLRRYIAVARDKGATAILITPAARLLYDFGALLDTHGRDTLAMQQLAAQEHVGLIDLNASSSDWIRALGEQAAKPYFLFVPEQGKADGTHFSRAGATAIACLVVHGWVQLQSDLKAQLRRDADCGAAPTPPHTAPRRRIPRWWCTNATSPASNPARTAAPDPPRRTLLCRRTGSQIRAAQTRAAQGRRHRPAPARQGRDLLHRQRPRGVCIGWQAI